MGIPGLTTFIEKRSQLYLEKYELRNTNVVIDGYSAAFQLYKWHTKSNDCFGGDYDEYANTITNFFHLLSECNITPYVIFDGGYEARKIATVMSRLEERIKSAEQLNSTTEGRILVFPLFLGETFKDVVLKLKIKCVRCDFESDSEAASIASSLKCPVMSYDSDFFIMDVLYIPFRSVEMAVQKRKMLDGKTTYNYISCYIYRMEKFLNSFDGMDKSKLQLLAVLLGNDYVQRTEFSLFYRHLNMPKSHGSQGYLQILIESLIIWLQKETIESAIRTVLRRYKYGKRKLIANKIQNAIKGYSYQNSNYLKYLAITSSACSKNIQVINVNNIAGNMKEEVVEDEEILEEGTENNSEEPDVFFIKYEEIPTIFSENFRKCLYPPCFMDILSHGRYYCQVEDYMSEYSHAISSEILSVIHRILRKSSGKLVCLARNENGHIKTHCLPECTIEVPSFMEIHTMNLDSRQSAMLKALCLDDSFATDCLNLFPESWQLFIIAVKYFIDKSLITWSLIYSLLLCTIFFNYVDAKVGIYRSSESFDKKFSTAVEYLLRKKKRNFNVSSETIPESLENISYNDSILCVKSLVSYFQMDNKMKIDYRIFDRQLVHSMVQFQSCLLHIKHLNSLLNLPYPDIIISKFFNGTFIYNLTKNFMERTNLDNYIEMLLKDCPSILYSFKLITAKLNEHCSTNL